MTVRITPVINISGERASPEVQAVMDRPNFGAATYGALQEARAKGITDVVVVVREEVLGGETKIGFCCRDAFMVNAPAEFVASDSGHRMSRPPPDGQYWVAYFGPETMFVLLLGTLVVGGAA